MPQNIGDNRIDPAGIAMVSGADMARLAKYALREGDIVYSRRGDVERRALVRKENAGWLCGTGCLRIRVGDQNRYDSRFVSYALGLKQSRAWIKRHAVGATMLNLNTSILSAAPLAVPGIHEQRAIAEVLGALDDKIIANETLAARSRHLADAISLRAAIGGRKYRIADVASMLTRGVTPKYTEGIGMIILNQKCVRGQSVMLAPARKTLSLSTRIDRVLKRDDVLVNSTGQGTLGRTARWIHALEATVDSHMTIVRFNSELVDPVCAGFALLRIESQIEGLAEGSTGQTELRRDLLGSLEIDLPSRSEQDLVSPELDALDSLVLGIGRESEKLAATRDEILPQLMAGKIRVSEARKTVKEVD